MLSHSVELALVSTSFRVVTTALVDGTRFSHRGATPGTICSAGTRQVARSTPSRLTCDRARRRASRCRTAAPEGSRGVTQFGTKRPIAGMRCDEAIARRAAVGSAMQGVSDVTGHFSMRAPVGKVHVLALPPDQSLSITGDDVEVAADATANVAVTAVRGKFGPVRGDAGFSLTPLTLPLAAGVCVNPAGGAAALGARDGDQLVAIDGASCARHVAADRHVPRDESSARHDDHDRLLRAGAPLTFKIPVIAAI